MRGRLVRALRRSAEDLASSGAQVQGYFGRGWIFGDYTRKGVVLLHIAAPGATDADLVYAEYDGTRVQGARAFRSLDCAPPGAIASVCPSGLERIAQA